MRRRMLMSHVVVLVLWLLVADAHAGPRQVYERHRSSVVAVTYYVETHFMRQVREVEGRDVGVVVSDALVLVNGSVVTSSSTGAQPHGFHVHFDGGHEIAADYVGRDEFANVAFLRLDGELPAGVKPLQFRRQPRVRVGDEVFVLGLLPENLDPMVRLASGRIVARVEKPKPFLVTDLAAEDALGGPVFNSAGDVIGVLSEMGGAGPAFAAGFGGAEDGYYGLILDPATLRPLIESPPRKGKSKRAWLGITLQALTPDMADYWGIEAHGGIIVNSVIPGSPAAGAGLQEGDLVVGMNGRPIPVREEDHVPIFVEQVGSAGVGTNLHLDVIRAGQPLEVTLVLVAAPKSRLDAEQYHSPEFELTVRELVFTDYRAFDLEPDFRGVLVSRIEEGGWSSVGGLQMGDIIQKVDDRVVESPDDVRQVLEEAVETEKRKLVFFVQRFGRTQFVTVQPNWDGES
ncbi:MAG: PDZ domain-containing protein [Candidatus Krumholzibacteriia bacterium]